MNKHGGKRNNAGRKLNSGNKKRMNFSLNEDVCDLIRTESVIRKMNMSALIEESLKSYLLGHKETSMITITTDKTDRDEINKFFKELKERKNDNK